jgi:hypothetical protein
MNGALILPILECLKPRIVGFHSLVECFDEEEWTDNQIENEKANAKERRKGGR